MAKKKLIWTAVIVSAVLIAIFLPGLSKYHRLKDRKARLDRGIEKLRKTELTLRTQQDKLQKDPTYIEKVARDKLQVTNKGETIIKIESKNAK